MNDLLFSHLIYADDLVLIAPSVRALQTSLALCDQYANENDITYNAKKTVCMTLRPKRMKNKDPDVYLASKKLEYVKCHKCLGVLISNDRKDDLAIETQHRNLYSRGNMIIRNFKNCNEQVKKQLFKSFCSSFYCASLWNSSEFTLLQVADRKFSSAQRGVSLFSSLFPCSLSARL